jgi:FMN reductase
MKKLGSACRIVGVNGSMRQGSATSAALGLVLQVAQRHGSEVQIIDLRTADLPSFRPDGPRPTNPTVLEVKALVAAADAFVLGSPDYHGTMSGVLKNFLDYFWHEFAGKLFGYVCASHEKGLTVMDHLRTAVRQCYGWSLPYGVAINPEEDLDPNGAVCNPKVAGRLRMLGRDMAVYGPLLRRQFLDDVAGPETDTFASRYRAH